MNAYQKSSIANLYRMLKIYLLGLLAVTLILTYYNATSYAVQNEPGEIEWTDQFGTFETDIATKVFATNGYVFVGGQTQGALPGQVNLGGSDPYVRKYDANGNVVWTRQFGTQENERVGGIYADSTGVYVAGDTLGALPGQINFGDKDIFIRKYDLDGNEVWTWQFGTDQADWPNEITIFDSHIYVAGVTWGEFPGQIYQGSTDAFIGKYDLDGNPVWIHQFGKDAYGIAVDQTGVYALGSLQMSSPTTYLNKYDFDGNEVWTQLVEPANGVYGAYPSGVAVDNSGIYVSGVLYNEDVIPYAFLGKYSAAGNEVWIRDFATRHTIGSAISISGSLVYISGQIGGCCTLPGQLPPGGGDAFVRAYDKDGNEVWTNQFGTTTYDDSRDISVNGNGVYVVGRTNGTFPGNLNEGGWDAFLTKFAVDNQPPIAEAGGPYSVDEGSSILLNGAASSDPDSGDTLTFEWDLDYDGIAFDVDATSPDPLFDATNLDGPHTQTVALRVMDSAGALSAIDSANVIINNLPPTIDSLSAPVEPVDINSQSFHLTVEFSDPSTVDVHEVQIDWGDSMIDTLSHASSPASQGHTYADAGVYTVTVDVSDDDTGVDESTYEFIVIYDPDGGFVTGGGWIFSEVGWCHLDTICAAAEGKANFGFVSKYKKGAVIPTGNTEFNFSIGGLNFHSDEYEWLVVNQGGTNAQYKGSGTINGSLAPTGTAYKFMIWAKNGDAEGEDTFRIKIWYEEAGWEEVVVYDNGFDQVIDGGSIKVHDGK